MKLFFLITLLTSFFHTQTLAQHEILKKGISDVGEFFNGQYYIINNGEDYKITILDRDLNIAQQFVRDGDGPAEARRVQALYIDKEAQKLYVLRQAGILMVFNSELELTEEINFGRNINATGMMISGDKIYFSMNNFYLIEAGDAELVLLEFANLNNPDNFVQITIPFSELSVKNLSMLQNVRVATFQSRFVHLNDEFYAALLGHSTLYQLDLEKQEIKKRIEIEYFEDVKYEVVHQEQFGYGFRSPGLSTSLFTFNDLVITSHSIVNNSFNETHLIVYDPVTGLLDKISEIDTMVEGPVVKIINDFMFFYEIFEQYSNYLEIQKIKHYQFD
ncbi:MAG: hypothetical protein LAT67_15605 [Balneolales bacterium]|nr:hypothetical protein [Balneolales bacterium]